MLASSISHDGGETVQVSWLHPEEALGLFRAGSIALAPPTYHILTELSSVKQLQQLVLSAEKRERSSIVPT